MTNPQDNFPNPWEKIRYERVELKPVNDPSCFHNFILKGIRAAECSKCGIGVIINGIKDYERLAGFAKLDKKI